MNCSCHNRPMYFNKDARCRRGGFWECREKRRERNELRISVYGTRLYVPDQDFKKFTKEAMNGRAKV